MDRGWGATIPYDPHEPAGLLKSYNGMQIHAFINIHIYWLKIHVPTTKSVSKENLTKYVGKLKKDKEWAMIVKHWNSTSLHSTNILRED